VEDASEPLRTSCVGGNRSEWSAPRGAANPARPQRDRDLLQQLGMIEPDFDTMQRTRVRASRENSARALRAELGLPEVVDVRSPGFLRFVIRLSERLDWDIPRADYPRLATLSGCLEYVRTLPA
jgi:hypothetical protein